MLKPSWLSKVRVQFLRSPTPQQIRRRCGVDCQGVAARAERMKGRNTPLVPLPFGARLGTIIIDRNLDLVAWLVIITLGHDREMFETPSYTSMMISIATSTARYCFKSLQSRRLLRLFLACRYPKQWTQRTYKQVLPFFTLSPKITVPTFCLGTCSKIFFLKTYGVLRSGIYIVKQETYEVLRPRMVWQWWSTSPLICERPHR